MVKESASKIKQDKTTHYTSKYRQEGRDFWRMEQSIVNTNQSVLYSDTGVLGSVAGVGSDRHLVLYYWLIPNSNTKDGISINISLV